MGHLPKPYKPEYKAELGYEPSLAIFDKPSVNTGVLSHKWVQYRPVSQISNTGVLQFNIPGTSNSYVNLKCTTLQIKGKVVKKDGSNLTEKDRVSIINAPLQTIWSQVDLSLQNKVINSEVSTNYAYKSYLDLLLNYDNHKQSSQLTSQLFFKERSGAMENLGLQNSGMFARQRLIEKSQIVQMEAPLCLDLCQQDRYILNGVPIGLKFWPNKPEFYIRSDDEESGFRFEIIDATLNVCLVDVSPGILVGHAEGLKYAPAVYPFFQSNVKGYAIPSGIYEHTIDNIFQGDIPSEILVGIVSSQGFTGDYTKNPFNFHHHNVSYCGFYVNDESVPKRALEPRYPVDDKAYRKNRNRRATPSDPGELPKSSEGSSTPPLGGKSIEGEDVSYVDAYLSLFGHEYESQETPSIDVDSYPFGYCLYKFQVSQNIDREDQLSLSRRGTTRLHFKFRKPLEKSATAVVYARFPRTLQIDQARNVYY